MAFVDSPTLAQDIVPGWYHVYDGRPEPELLVHNVRVGEPGRDVWLDYTFMDRRTAYYTPWDAPWMMRPADTYVIVEEEELSWL